MKYNPQKTNVYAPAGAGACGPGLGTRRSALPAWLPSCHSEPRASPLRHITYNITHSSTHSFFSFKNAVRNVSNNVIICSQACYF